MVDTVQHKTGSSCRYTKSHKADNHLEWGTTRYTIKVFFEISLTVFTEQAMKDRSNPELQTQQHCNGNGGRSIQWIELVQHVEDGTQRLNELNQPTTRLMN